MINNREKCIDSAVYKLRSGLFKQVHGQLEFFSIEWEWVKGHNGNDGNENADSLPTYVVHQWTT